MSYVSIPAHRTMALDRVRNDAYAAALREVVTPSSVVLDLGAGTGIHGLMAARLGAKRVYLIEPEDVISVAAEAARANALDGVVTCLRGRLEEVQLPEPVDVIVSAMTGNFLLTEDLLPVLMEARNRWLAPGGRLIPDRAEMHVVPVAAPRLHAREVADWSATQHGVTLHPARAYAANTLHFRWERDEVLPLADPAVVHAVDFTRDEYAPLHAEASFTVQHAGLCHGFAGWFSMRLGSRWVSTAPDAPPMHWSPAFLPLDPPIDVDAGDVVSLRLDRPPYGDWTWRAAWRGGSQRHSTLLSAPMSLETLRKAALDYAPTLNVEGEAMAFVLAQCTGSNSVRAIAEALRQRWPARYSTADAAQRFVQSIVKHGS